MRTINTHDLWDYKEEQFEYWIFLKKKKDFLLLRWCGRQSVKGPHDPTSRYSAVCNPLPWSIGKPRDLLPTQRIEQRWQDVPSVIICGKIVTFVFLRRFLSCWLWWSKWPLWGSIWQGTMESLWPTARNRVSQSKTRPGSKCFQHHKSLEVNLFPVKLSKGNWALADILITALQSPELSRSQRLTWEMTNVLR